jgi:hypothetical protein
MFSEFFFLEFADGLPVALANVDDHTPSVPQFNRLRLSDSGLGQSGSIRAGLAVRRVGFGPMTPSRIVSAAVIRSDKCFPLLRHYAGSDILRESRMVRLEPE